MRVPVKGYWFYLVAASVFSFLAIACSEKEPYQGPIFTDVADAAGVQSTNFPRAAIWADFNGDGFEDIFVAVDQKFVGQYDLLYWNAGDGTFREGARAAGIHGDRRPFCAVAADYDNDGDIDIFVANYADKNVLYRNNGDGTFTDISDVAALGEVGTGAAWGDFDQDGLVDIFVAHEEKEPNRLFRNLGAGHFEEITSSAGIVEPIKAFSPAWADYDGDGDLDLYVSCDGPNLLYRNNGDGTLTNVAEEAGVADGGVGRGVAWADYDNDGDFDLYLANLFSPNVLYRNDGDGKFTVATDEAGVADDNAAEGVAWADYDNDGWLDLFLSRFGKRGSGGTTTLLFRNRGDGTFEEVSEGAGVRGKKALHYACPWADYDRDGDLDFYVTVGAKAEELISWVHLYQNQGTQNNWLRLRLVGDRSNRLGIGARVFIETTVGRQMAQVSGGSGFNSQGSPLLHFGMGRAESASVRVEWPSGIVQQIPDVAANQEVEIREAIPSS